MQLSGEQAEQAAVIQWLRSRGHLHWHTPNEGDFPPFYRAKLMALGLLPGVSDILVITGPPLRLYAVEMKIPGGRVSGAQSAFIRRIIAAGGVGTVAYGREEAIAWMQSQGL